MHMPELTHLKLGTLGGPATFAGEATAAIREKYPELSEPAYFKSMEDCWSGLVKGIIDVVVLGCERTGQAHHSGAIVSHGLYVMDSFALPIKCNLYVKPGTRRDNIRKITGHGSIFQCIPYLEKHFPGVPREMHGLNSVEAAKAALVADGTEAAVGSRSLPRVVSGLEVMAEGIDDGSIGGWWLISSRPHFSDRPTNIVITGCFGPDGKLGEMIGAMLKLECQLTAVAGFAADHGISTYNYLLTFKGDGSSRTDIVRAISTYDGRLAGAFRTRA
jgi:prephenate dehydratase